MRRHAQASPLGPNAKPAKRRGLLAVAGALVLAIATVFGVTAASADTTPSVSIAPPSSVSYTSAHLSGTVNPNGGPSTTEWRFEYSSTGEEGSYTPGPGGELSGPEAEGTSPVAVQGNLTGLAPGAFYFVRLVASNEFGNNRSAAQTFLFTESIASPSVSIDAPTGVTSSDAHFEGEINPGGTDPAFAVDWRFDCTPACPGLEGALPAGTSPQMVQADPTSLLPGTAYEVRLIAKNAGEPVSAGPESFTTEVVAPQVESQSASPASSEAMLNARLNPGGDQTVYFFQYGPTAAYGHSTSPKATVGATAKLVSNSISGLAPGTTYHYRLIAENSKGKAEGADRTFTTLVRSSKGSCPNEAFRTGAMAQLPDCRAYEMVSPSFKNGTDVAGFKQGSRGNPTWSSVSGDRTIFSATGGFAGQGSSFGFNSYFAGRTAAGWASAGISPISEVPQAGLGSMAMQAFSDDLRYSVFWTLNPPLTPDATPRAAHLYRRDNFTGEVVNLTPVGAPETEIPGRAPNFAAASDDFDHIIFESMVAMAPGAVDGFANLYEWANGEVRLVGILPDESPASEGSVAGRTIPSVEAALQGVAATATYLETAISNDGARIVWTDRSSNQIYLRVNGTSTKHVSASQRTNDSGPGGTDPEGPQPAAWQYSTPDGSVIYFTSTEKLTNNSTADVAANVADLYAYDVASGELSDLSVSTSSEPAGVRGMLGASADGAYVYFAATGVLAPGAIAEPETANIYVWHAGQVSYIGSAPFSERNIWNNNAQDAGKEQARVTRDGKVVLFITRTQLTSYDNAGYQQIYRYDAVSESLTCVSCNPRTAASTGSAGFGPPSDTSVTYRQKLTRVLSADGRRVFFNTPEPLVPADTNGQVDVYQWENGEVQLISSGQGSGPSFFAEASASGDDVFFVTRERLLSGDIDDNVDLYDAKVGGGFAQTDGAGACLGEDCQPNAVAPSATNAPASASLHGRGNTKSKRVTKPCGKAKKATKAKKKGHCVKKKGKGTATKKRAGHKRGGAK